MLSGGKSFASPARGRKAEGSSQPPSSVQQRSVVRQILHGPRVQAQRWEAEADAVAVEALRRGAASEAGVRRQVGSLLGYDFSGVRLHRDAAGVEAEGAHAVTAGADVYLAPGRYRPDHPLGRALLAHELTHVAQQDAAPRLEALRRELPSRRLSARAATLSDPQGGLSPAPRGMRQRCSSCSGGCGRTLSLRESFRSNNSHLTAAELDKIERAGEIATRDNEVLRDSFLRYYSSHEIRKATESELSKWSAETLAQTSPNSDTLLRPSVLDASASDDALATLLIHEYTHTRHHTNYMGTRDYEEGDSYGVEFFFAKRIGNAERQRQIYALVMLNPTKLVMAPLVPDLQRRFQVSYATLTGLYEVIDTGASTHPGSPFTTPALLTRAEAQALATELVDTQEESHSARLKAIMAWVGDHLSEFSNAEPPPKPAPEPSPEPPSKAPAKPPAKPPSKPAPRRPR